MANINLTCPICGEPTSVWYGNARKDRLCRTHAQQLKDGLIEQCPDCGKWIQSNTICDCKQKATTVETPVVKQTPNKKEETTNSTDLKCIICGESSNGQHFCRSCYHKFKDKILYSPRQTQNYQSLNYSQ